MPIANSKTYYELFNKLDIHVDSLHTVFSSSFLTLYVGFSIYYNVLTVICLLVFD